MADKSPQSCLRASESPRGLESERTRGKSSPSSKRQRSAQSKASQRSSRRESNSGDRNGEDAGNRRSQTTSRPTPNPCFELNTIAQPARGIVLGTPIDTSVVVCLRNPIGEQHFTPADVDTSRVFVTASLVAESRSGERLPVEAGLFTGQKMFDSLHGLPEEWERHLASQLPYRLTLGYCTFPELLIRQSGTYRIRTTLVKMSSSGDGGVTSITSVDSDPIKVERRPTIRRQ